MELDLFPTIPFIRWDCPFCSMWYERYTEREVQMAVRFHFAVRHENRWAPWL